MIQFNILRSINKLPLINKLLINSLITENLKISRIKNTAGQITDNF